MYPEITLSSTLSLPTYFVIISLATVVASLWFIRRAEARKLSRVVAIDFTITCLVAGFLGARLLHVFYEEPSYYLAHPLAVLQIWNGGYVYFGGVIAAWLALVAFCRIKREPFWFWADTATLPISLGYAIGRIACFFNGCCYGRECHLPWAVFMDGAYRHPTQLYASFWEFGLLLFLRWLEPRLKYSGLLFNVWLVGHGCGRVVMEAFRDDPRGPFMSGLSLGTWMSLGLALVAAGNLFEIWLEHKAGRASNH